MLMAGRGADRVNRLLKRTSNRINDHVRAGMTRGMEGAQYNVHHVKFEFMQVKVVLVIASAPTREERRAEKSDEFLSGAKNCHNLIE